MVRKGRGAQLALAPTWLLAAVGFYACLAWTFYISFTGSRLLPSYRLVGLASYETLFASPRWLTALANMFLFGGLFIVGSLLLGLLLAVALDRQVRFEGGLRTIFLYPFALSFIVTGLAWQWFLNPTFGLQQIVRDLGFESFEFAWIVDRDLAIYTIVMAGIWRNAGLVMAILLAGLRNVDVELWRATRIDAIPVWRVYVSIVLPLLRPAILTAVILLATSVVTSYDLIIAMTGGGPGNATDIPAKFVVDFLFTRANIGVASAGAVVMLGAAVAALAPYVLLELRRRGP